MHNNKLGMENFRKHLVIKKERNCVKLVDRLTVNVGEGRAVDSFGSLISKTTGEITGHKQPKAPFASQMITR